MLNVKAALMSTAPPALRDAGGLCKLVPRDRDRQPGNRSDLMMQTLIARWGGSLALRIPRPVAKRVGLDEGEMVELSVEAGCLVVRPRRLEPRLDELLAEITPENLPSSFDEAPRGQEAL
jgi:antitoxin MazE